MSMLPAAAVTAANALIRTVAAGVKRAKAKKKKKNTASANNPPKRGGKQMDPLVSRARQPTIQAAGVSLISPVRGSSIRPVCRLPFDAGHIGVYGSTSVTNPYFAPVGTSTPLVGTFNLDLTPFANNDAGWANKYILGPAIGVVASGFQRWRFCAPLTFEFRTAVNTGTDGQLALGVAADPVVSGQQAFADVSSLPCSSTGAVWGNWSFRVTPQMNPTAFEWKYNRVNAVSVAEQREDYAASISISGAGHPTTATGKFIGTVWIRGAIEFSDSADVRGLTGPDLLPQSSLQAAVSSNSSVAAPSASSGRILTLAFGADGTACTAAAPFGSGKPKILYGDNCPFTFTSTNMVAAQPTTVDASFDFSGLTITGSPTYGLVGTATTTGVSSGSTTTYGAMGFKLVAAANGDGVSVTGPTTLTDGTLLVTLRFVA